VGGLDGVEILSLEVLDEGELESLTVVEPADDRGDALETGRRGRSDAPLTGDQLIAVEGLRDEDRLEDAVLADARRQRGHLGVTEATTRLIRVRADARERDVDGSAAGVAARRDQRGKPAAQALGTLGSNGHDRATSGSRGVNAGYLFGSRRAFRARNSSARAA
jgi:hypothetical protein